jgi:hypothetical protein
MRAAIAVVACAIPSVVQAHVSITPRESAQGATEKYTVRIPTEGKVATTAAELDVPEGVIVETLLAGAGWTNEVKRKDDRIVAITWHADVKPGEFIEVGFVARNPRQGTEIVWTLRKVRGRHRHHWTTDRGAPGPPLTRPASRAVKRGNRDAEIARVQAANARCPSLRSARLIRRWRPFR